MPEQFEQYSTTFPDGSVWTRTSEVTITYKGPRGDYEWTFPNHIECSAAWLAVCLK